VVVDVDSRISPAVGVDSGNVVALRITWEQALRYCETIAMPPVVAINFKKSLRLSGVFGFTGKGSFSYPRTFGTDFPDKWLWLVLNLRMSLLKNISGYPLHIYWQPIIINKSV
jgi:hypothetical protein